jgi:hypothetical protein
MPWNNLQTANKVDGGIDTTAGAGVVSVTVANGSSSITKQVTLGNQSATRAFSDFASDLGSAINESELEELMSLGDVEFDLDIYKILKKAIQGSFKSQIVPLRKFPAINP